MLEIPVNYKIWRSTCRGKCIIAIGNSGLKASVVGLGTFAIGVFWGGVEEKKSISAIQASIDQG